MLVLCKGSALTYNLWRIQVHFIWQAHSRHAHLYKGTHIFPRTLANMWMNCTFPTQWQIWPICFVLIMLVCAVLWICWVCPALAVHHREKRAWAAAAPGMPCRKDIRICLKVSDWGISMEWWFQALVLTGQCVVKANASHFVYFVLTGESLLSKYKLCKYSEM